MVFFWSHLIAGTIGGVVIFIMSVTGVLLMYEKQILAWADTRAIRIDAPAAGVARMPMEELVAKIRDQRQALPTTAAMRNEANAPLLLAYGREGAVYLNPYTGRMVGQGAQGMRDFFRIVTEWHRWLGAPVENRAVPKAITGACNLAFLFLVMSGFYIWFPRKWRWQHLRPVIWFKRGLPGKARDFNWHNAIGAWCAVPLFFVVLGATVISYPWASNLAYRIAGSQPPAPASKAGAVKGEGKKGSAGEVRATVAPGAPASPPIELNLAGMDRAWKRAEGQVAGWKAITLRLPGSDLAPWSFTIDEGYAGQPQLRGTLTVNRETGEIARWETFDSYDAGRRFRTWLRFMHTGEYYGLAGQTVAGVASAGGAVLVYTGLALAWRRLWAWRTRRRKMSEVAESVAA